MGCRGWRWGGVLVALLTVPLSSAQRQRPHLPLHQRGGGLHPLPCGGGAAKSLPGDPWVHPGTAAPPEGEPAAGGGTGGHWGRGDMGAVGTPPVGGRRSRALPPPWPPEGGGVALSPAHFPFPTQSQRRVSAPPLPRATPLPPRVQSAATHPPLSPAPFWSRLFRAAFPPPPPCFRVGRDDVATAPYCPIGERLRVGGRGYRSVTNQGGVRARLSEPRVGLGKGGHAPFVLAPPTGGGALRWGRSLRDI